MPNRLNIEGLIKSYCMRYSKRIFKVNKDNQKMKYYDPLIKTCIKPLESNRCQYCASSNKKCVTMNYLLPPSFHTN
jgi:hypothetical protein